MPGQVQLKIVEGERVGEVFTFTGRTTCIVGRAHDANIKLCDNPNDKLLSRYHCFLDINPPDARIRDMGSLNGTFINDKKIGQREQEESPEDALKKRYPEHDLKTNDRIGIGDTVFGVEIIREEGIQKETGEDLLSKHYRDGGLPPLSNPLQLIEYLIKQSQQETTPGLAAIQGYSIVKELGRGGMGAVYLGRHERTHEHVALKVMLPVVATNEKTIQLFLRETEISKTLKHDNIVELRDFGCSSNTFFFTLEYCDGGSVADLIKTHEGKVPIDDALAVALQVLAGLDYAHHAKIQVRLLDGNMTNAHGVVHRDLKPSNILLTGSGSQRLAKVADFGLSKAFDTAGMSGQTCSGDDAMGTPVFMPRQQVLDFLYAKPECDVWAMAATLYYMLTGSYPRESTAADAFLAVLSGRCVPIQERNPSIPAKLAKIIDTALIDNPEIVIKSAKELRSALSECY